MSSTMQTKFTVAHKRTSSANVVPDASILKNGEIAVRDAAGDEALFIKNTNNETVTFVNTSKIEESIATITTYLENTSRLETRVATLETGKADKSDTYTKSQIDSMISAAGTPDMSAYLKKTEADSTYESQTHAVQTYQPKGNYLTRHQDLSDYLTKSEASTTYAKTAPAGTSYATYTQLQDVDKKIPTKVSQLTNDSGFQTASDVSTSISGKANTAYVDEQLKLKADKSALNSYYTKTETNTTFLTKEDASNTYQLKGAPSGVELTKNAVEAVLTGDITSHTHSQYLTSASLSGYATTGSLSAYAKTTDVNTKLADYATAASVTETLKDYATTSALNSGLEGKVDKQTGYGLVPNANIDKLAALRTNQQITDALALKADNATTYTKTQTDDAINAAVSNRLTSSDLTGYAKETFVTTKIQEHSDAADAKYLQGSALDNYYTKGQCDGKFLTEHQSLADYVSKTQLAEVLIDYATSKGLTTAINNQPTATTSAKGLMSAADKANLDSLISAEYFGQDKLTISSIPTSGAKLRIVEVNSGGTFGFSDPSSIPLGTEIHFVLHNPTPSTVVIAIPTERYYMNLGPDQLSIETTKYAELNVICGTIGSDKTLFIRGIA